MINYYRSSVRNTHAEEQLRTVEAPTLVIWGQRDRYLGQELAEPLGSDVPNLAGVHRIPNASHWVHHDAPEQVNQLMIDFFAPARTR
jgi:pimeloyl-ACP methyl ester carboxylesterase